MYDGLKMRFMHKNFIFNFIFIKKKCLIFFLALLFISQYLFFFIWNKNKTMVSVCLLKIINRVLISSFVYTFIYEFKKAPDKKNRINGFIDIPSSEVDITFCLCFAKNWKKRFFWRLLIILMWMNITTMRSQANQNLNLQKIIGYKIIGL